MKRWPSLIVLFALLAGAASLAWRDGQSLNQFWLHYQPPAAASLTPLPPTTPPQALTSQVVVVVIGGLRADASLTLPTLSLLRQSGASRTLVVPVPSENATTWATLLTGAPPYLHGVIAGFPRRPLQAETIFDEAKSRSLTTALAGPAAWGQLVSRSVDLPMLDREAPATQAAADDAALAHGLNAVKAKASLTLVYWGGPAAAAQASHGAGNAYLMAAAEADARLAQLLAGVDLTRTTVIVTSDHGVTDWGGSGGGEPAAVRVPLVAAGPGIHPGRYSDASLEDLAPTLGALLGTPATAAATGSILTDMLALPPAAQAADQDLLAKRQSALYQTLVEGVGGMFLEPTGVQGDTPRYQAELRRQVETARRYQLWLEVRRRLPRAGGIALALLLYLFLLSRQSYGRAALRGAVLYFVLYYLLFLGPWSFGPFWHQHRLTFSLSEMGLSPYTAYLRQRALEAAVAALMTSAITGWWAGWKAGSEQRADTLTKPTRPLLPGLHWSLAVTTLIALQALVFWALFGGPFSWTLPPLAWLTKQRLDLLQGVVVAGASPLWVVAAGVLYRLAWRWQTRGEGKGETGTGGTNQARN